MPVELDRIYRSLRDLSQALGPNGVNRDGTLDNLLRAGDEALSGQGERGNRMIRELSAAATTFGEGSGDLFDTVTELATFTGTLAENDRLVRAFLRDLAGVSADLADERQEISAALAAVARAVGSVEDFVGENREALVTDVEKLTRVVKNLDSERDSLDTALTVAPVAMGNLALAFNNESNSIGSRIGIGGNVWDADGFLCGIVQQAGLPRVSADLACELFEMLLEPITTQVPFIPPEHSGRPSGTANRPAPGGTDLADLLAGGR
ncbi:MCE family protein [Nocardioides sp. REDSEA-S30_B4]|uniref:MCE family protein n=1 Tax=Nocardioides sp. REDSEA-S30_B4 TaxID=1811552 RepID=UPI0025E23573|nr:MCE family protein [Nocardioides sp. REDSEA-S30_B4]